MTTNEITIVVNLSSKDIMKFQFSFFLRQWYFWLFSFLFVMSTSVIVYSLKTKNLSDVPSPALFFFLFMLFFLFIIFRSSKKAFNNKFVKEEKRYLISEERLLLESESITQKILWNDLVRTILTKESIYLFISSNSAHIIPLRELTMEQRQFLSHIMKTKVKKQKPSFVRPLGICLILFLVTIGIVRYFLNS
jgi:hypothetical protein